MPGNGLVQDAHPNTGTRTSASPVFKKNPTHTLDLKLKLGPVIYGGGGYN